MERRTVMLSVTRRQFLQFSAVSAAGLGASSLGVLGFSSTQVLAEVRQYKLERTTETRNTCPYCSVGCGLLMYSLGDKAKNAPAEIIHIEGDPDHPVNRGTLCPKGAGLLDYVHSRNGLMYPEYRAPGSDKFVRISWGEAFDRIARLMKDDRDKNFIAKNADGVTVNRWLSTGFLAASASSNESGYLTFFQAEDCIRDKLVTGVQTCALPIEGDGIRDKLVTGVQTCALPI